LNSASPLLEARNVSFAVDGAPIISGVSLAFDARRIYAFVGPNGAGKSTLIRLLCLLQKPTSGNILVEGEDATALWPDVLSMRRRLALVTQSPVMFKANVFDNVALGLRFRGFSRKEAKRKAEEALSFVSMDSFARRYAPSLSIGEAQMVALARAIAVEPHILFLDEPAANLDPRNTKALEEHLKRLNRERGTTVIMVTHLLKQAQRLAQEAIFLHRGMVVERGEAGAFFLAPQKEQTKQFLAGELIA
jgi:tungstate transport system ATP-binding protein